MINMTMSEPFDIETLVQQAFVSRFGNLAEIWLASSKGEADANQNLFWKAYTIPIDNPKRSRSLMRAFSQREQYHYV
jgi:hypothetical protein